MMSKEKAKSIYELDLHETIQIRDGYGSILKITRVPGGWLYNFKCFVPFDNEYQIKNCKGS